MKTLYFAVILLIMNTSYSQETTIYLIRHAEKADGSSDPHLSEAGHLRAAKWAEWLSSKSVTQLYSTPYNRTKETLQPLADKIKAEIVTYNPSQLDLKELAGRHSGKSIVVAGHSNTIPHYVNNLIGKALYTDLSESEFGVMYIITIQGDTVTHTMEKL
jgi:2,3-bisphosphoglycerate-dependent phosphoglycerate mutase